MTEVTSAKSTKIVIFPQFKSAKVWSQFSLETLKFPLVRIPPRLIGNNEEDRYCTVAQLDAQET